MLLKVKKQRLKKCQERLKKFRWDAGRTDIHLDCPEQTRTYDHLICTSSLALKQHGVTETLTRISTRSLMVRHAMISYTTTLSLDLFIHGKELVKAIPQGCIKEQRNIFKVLGTRCCAINRNCYFKCIKHKESVHGKSLKVQVNLLNIKNLLYP